MNNKINNIQEYFDELLPDAHCELDYFNDYSLLIAIMLSAQTTDAKVNKVTPILFSKYKSLKELSLASIADIEEILRPLGMFHNKAINVISIANDLLDKFNGIVPRDKQDLTSMKGVGIKTANVFRAEYLKIPEFPVDTHVKRVSNRLGLSNSEDVNRIEEDLKNIFDENRWIKLHHQFIHFGRYHCKAISPSCKSCKLKQYCNYFKG